jgi:hypothetical protein
MPIQIHSKADVLAVLGLVQERLAQNDSVLMASLAALDNANATDLEARRVSLSRQVSEAMDYVGKEKYHAGEDFHSRHPLAGLCQAHLNGQANAVTHNDVGDVLPAVVNLFGEGNPIVWAPVMVNILVEHLKGKANFITATDAKSYIQIPDKCKIAILGDWGADNDHAQRIAALVKQQNPDFAVHLGDIYYAGSEYECQRFLANWPLQGKGNSFALNGNHEMYSRGIPYFGTVLPSFGQEASYFTLYNTNWQLHGIDTAYVPFSIDGSVEEGDRPSIWKRMMDTVGSKLPFVDHENFDCKPDSRLQMQWKWLQDKMTANPTKRNIFLSHNQPVSAYMPEFEASVFLLNQFWRLRETIPNGLRAVTAWFFGHEHKCTIYKDAATEFKARLIGNGAIPHSVQALVQAAEDETNTSCTPVSTMNNRSLVPDVLGVSELDLAISSFALLTLDGPDAYVEYINEDGSLFLREKLSGGPNEVLEWGKGYTAL